MNLPDDMHKKAELYVVEPRTWRTLFRAPKRKVFTGLIMSVSKDNHDGVRVELQDESIAERYRYPGMLTFGKDWHERETC